jgi:hypothetical protein
MVTPTATATATPDTQKFSVSPTTDVPRETPHAQRSPFVQLPTELLTADLPATAVVAWCLLAAHVRPDEPLAWPSREYLMRRLGHAARDPHTVSAATTALEAAGWLEVDRVHHAGKTRNVYRPLCGVQPGDGRTYVDLPAKATDALTAGHISTAELVALARWLDAGGHRGHTRRSLRAYAARYGGSVRTAKRHRSALVDAGLLEVRTDPGRRTITAVPGHLPDPSQLPAEPGPKTPHRTPQTGAKNPPSPGPKTLHHRGQKTPTEVPKRSTYIEVPLTPPNPPSDDLAGRVGTTPTGEGSRELITTQPTPALDPLPTVDALLAALPLPIRADASRTRASWRTHLAHCLEAGWTPPRIVEVVTEQSWEGTRKPSAVLTHRLRELATANPAHDVATARPDWCGTCDEATRHVDDLDGRPRRCPGCHPGTRLPAPISRRQAEIDAWYQRSMARAMAYDAGVEAGIPTAQLSAAQPPRPPVYQRTVEPTEDVGSHAAAARVAIRRRQASA